MRKEMTEQELFGKEKIVKVLLRIAPPVMASQLIQALYNVVDSFFVGRFSDDALTAVTVIYPIQLIIIALAVGTGVGVNTYMANRYAVDDSREADKTAGTGMILAVLSYAVVALTSYFIMPFYVRTMASEPGAIEGAISYGRIVCIGSLGTFLEGNWSKVHQAKGKMIVPMLAQVAGALTNVVLDPILIFGVGKIPSLGVAGAAYATIAGQILSAIIVGIKGFRMPPAPKEFAHFAGKIYYYGFSSICMQALYTVYIVLLNIILAKFSDAAVTVLGLYYKAQSFFFIPLFGLQTCIVPVLSYNYTQKNYGRCKEIVNDSLYIALAFMVIGIACFEGIPDKLIKIFSASSTVMAIGVTAFRIIGTSFISAVFSLMFPVFFQAIGKGFKSVFLSLLRQIICLVPIFWALSYVGLDYTWISFPVSETVAGAVGLTLYVSELRKWRKESAARVVPSSGAEVGSQVR